MSYDSFSDPSVKSPRDGQPRIGRGFSRAEIQAAGLTVKEARRMGVIVDLRRKTSHPENAEALTEFSKTIQEVAASVSVEVPFKAIEDAVAELSSLRAVNKAEAQLLVDAGIKTLEDLAYMEISKVAKKSGIDEDRLTEMVKAALKKV
ncbi:MAG: ribosomal protein L13e [Candidatus Thorarchaeota archaeon]|nr:MAG: ribosomal protein L13e [Candidatus Thorarchaeota archaeon]